ncbi:MAG: 4Fe-4S binding protein [Candidatus Omnitrophota bacterium]
MAKRKIIKIDQEKCNGCGLCIPNCPEGALQVIDGKARLISDLFCDGLGACLGHCPQGAISFEEREAEKYQEKVVSLEAAPAAKQASQLSQWPIQLNLVPAFAPFLQGAGLLICADCVPFAYADFHRDLLAGRILLVGCPKFDDLKLYEEKLS